LDRRLPLSIQTANAVELLKRCAAICEPTGLTMLLEPINHCAHRPELFLNSVPQAYDICRKIGSPSCKILVDVPHRYQTDANLVECIDRAWPEIAYLQLGDSPGRKEPGTGMIDYRGLFDHLRARGFRGILGMEHGNSLPGKAGERAVIDAYVRHDGP
jgi:hydroxypyruvate isomerase